MKKLSYDTSAHPVRASAAILKILSNKHRFDILSKLLISKQDICVQELADATNASQSATSHQLAFLESHGLITSVRSGKTKCYYVTKTPLTKKVTAIMKLLS